MKPIDEQIREGYSEGQRDFHWSKEDFLRLGEFATEMNWGVQYMGCNHFIKDEPTV